MEDSFPEMMTQREVAAAFRVTPRTVWAWVNQGKLKAVRSPGGRSLFYATEVRSMLETRNITNGFQE